MICMARSGPHTNCVWILRPLITIVWSKTTWWPLWRPPPLVKPSSLMTPPSTHECLTHGPLPSWREATRELADRDDLGLPRLLELHLHVWHPCPIQDMGDHTRPKIDTSTMGELSDLGRSQAHSSLRQTFDPIVSSPLPHTATETKPETLNKYSTTKNNSCQELISLPSTRRG